MKFIKELEAIPSHNWEVEFEGNDRETFLTYARENMSVGTLEDLMIEWAIVELLKEYIAANPLTPKVRRSKKKACKKRRTI
jgi:hypothetical protein